MHLSHTYQLLLATRDQKGMLKVTGAQDDHEIRQMADVGLIEAIAGDSPPEATAAAYRITVAGEAFLRVFQDHDFAVACDRAGADFDC